jgi:hypothetical protein
MNITTCVYSGGDLAFTIGIDTNKNYPITCIADVIEREDSKDRVIDREFHYDESWQLRGIPIYGERRSHRETFVQSAPRAGFGSLRTKLVLPGSDSSR